MNSMHQSMMNSPNQGLQHNTIGTSVLGNESSNAQGIDTAAQLVNKQLNYDSSFPSLYDMLEVPALGGASVSGLNEKDYPSGGDGRVQRHLHTLKKVSLPSDLLHHFQHMQSNCMMGLFPEIRRAWLTIDSDIYVWMYEDGSDLAYFDGLNDTILSVGFVRPKSGIFKPYIEYLLCLSTLTEIVLLGVSFSSADSRNVMHLLPEPLFSVPTDGAYILTIKGTSDGRIFYGTKDGSLWELVYQAEDGWFSRKCQKVNHSKSFVTYILPAFLTLSEDDPVSQIEVDDSRHIIYTLTEKGSISVFDLGSDGKSTSKVLTLHHSTIMNMATQIAKTIDKANFKNVVGICPVDVLESHPVHVILITGTGVRLYYSTTPFNNPLGRPCQMTLLHIRLPPGYAANALTHRPSRVHKCLYSHGRAILCASESTESDVIWTVSRDQYPYHPSLTESQAVLAIDGFVWALADVTPTYWRSALNPPTPLGTQPPLLVTQHQQPPRQLVLLSASGAHILTTLRPVDQLKHLLQESSNVDSPAVKDFFLTMSPIQACATAFILCMDPNLQESQVGELAREAIFRYGCTTTNQIQDSFQTPQHPQFTFQPAQMSTPFNVQSPNNQSSVAQNMDQLFSPLHNALYLYLARILRPIWSFPLVKQETVDNKAIFVPILSCDEVSFLARRVELMTKFMSANQGASLDTSINNTSIAGFACSNNLNERSSLLSLRNMLGQCIEILRLWVILHTHNFPLIAQSLSKEAKDRLATLTLQDLILSGKEMTKSFIMALMDRYHGDNASIDAISQRLRDVCPTIFRVEDAKISKANEIILLAKSSNNRNEKEGLFRKAVELCKEIGHAISIGGICNQLASGGWYEGIVDLCLSVASQRDPNGQGLHYYKNKEPNDDPQGYMYFTSRMECYRVMMEHIYQLVGSTGTPSPVSAVVPARPGPPSPPDQSIPGCDAGQFAEQMISLIVNSRDELAHVTLYQWLLDTCRTERLLSVQSQFLENFFLKSDAQGPMNDLLWRFYERNKEYYKAAKTLYLLTNQVGERSLTERVEYLGRASMCLSASPTSTTTSYADFMLHLQEKKDVANLQLMILNAIEAKGGSAEVIASLNSELLDITTLYEKYAEPFELWECKLAVVHCAGHYEPQLIQSLWSHIIDEELNRLSMSAPVRIESLSKKMESLSKAYSNSPNYFPLEHIIKTCELGSVKLGVEDKHATWVVTCLQKCGIPVSKLINIYHRLYSAGDSVWEVERSPYHLLKILSHLFGLVTNCQVVIAAQEKRALTEQCLDYIAAYLTDLGSSADPTAAIVSSHLRTHQVKLEKQ